mgnify:CR=1 FL=1
MGLNNTTTNEDVLVALGANLPSAHGSPRQTLEVALPEIEAQGMKIVARSRWYRSAPVPISSQDWYINGVVSIETDLGPEDVLSRLHMIEDRFGRERGERNAARVLDLDLISWRNQISHGETPPILPHPRMHDRAFVLLPMADVVPAWVHPVSGRTLTALIKAIPEDQITEAL